MFDKEKCALRRDRSKKGCVDTEIKPLLDAINALPDYYTTSSCAGRIVLLEKRERKCDSRLIYVSHQEASHAKVWQAMKALGCFPIWFKQESFIVHVCCRSIEAASSLLQCAHEAGLKHSGIISMQKKTVVEVVGVECMETIVARDGHILVSDEYLRELVNQANKKMTKNLHRIQRFETRLKLLALGQPADKKKKLL
jgi:tRNA wybutosine-synthesizing protein 3